MAGSSGKLVRFAVLMLVVYAVVIGFGLNEFRKTPVGFIPQLDRGYLIIVTQLPPAASLARTDEVNRRAVEIALKVPGIAHAVNIVGFSGATFTNAPNAGAVFVTLDPFEKRAKDTEPIRRRHPGPVVQAPAGDPGRAHLRRRAAAGFRHRQCRRLPHDGRGPRRARLAGLAGRGLRDDGPGRADAGPAPGVLAVREHDAAALSRHRSHQGAVARHQYSGRVRRAADLSRLVLCQRLQSVRPHLSRGRAGAEQLSQRHRRRSENPRAQQQRRYRAARRLHHGADRYRAVPRAALQSLSGGRTRRRGGARLQPGPGDQDHGEARGRNAAAKASPTNGRRSPSSNCAPATPPSSPSCWRWCSCSWCWRRSSRA